MCEQCIHVVAAQSEGVFFNIRAFPWLGLTGQIRVKKNKEYCSTFQKIYFKCVKNRF